MSADLRRRKGESPKDEAPAAAAAAPGSPPPSNGRAVIVGGGPAGALSAKLLADRNFSVTLFESHPHPSSNPNVEKNKAYVISVGQRGQRALRRAGIDPIKDLDDGVACSTYARYYAKRGKFRVMKTEEPSAIFRRQKLTASLLRLAEESGAEVKCGWTLKEADLDGRKLTFARTAGGGGDETMVVPYDLLVGADGVRSAVRSFLSAHVASMEVKTEEDSMEYQVAVLPSWRTLLSDVAGSGLADSPPETTITYADPASNSNSLAFPLRDGNTLVCVICPGGRLGGLKKKSGDYDAALGALYPNWTPEARRELAAQLGAEDNVPASGGTCVWSSHIGHPPSGVVLVGDSGHGMWPSLGQGCIAALESAAVLADAVEAVCGTGHAIPSSGAGVRGVDVSAATGGERAGLIAEEYQGLRHGDASAAVDLTYNGIGGRKVRGAQNMTLLFKVQVGLMMVASKLSAGLVPQAAAFRVMRGDDVSYSTLRWQMKAEKMVTQGFLMAVVCAIAARMML